jgi:hypothetical protein
MVEARLTGLFRKSRKPAAMAEGKALLTMNA